MKLKKTFGDGGSNSNTSCGDGKEKSTSIFYTMGDKPTLSPVEISPDTETHSSPTDTDQDKSDYIEELEKDIVKSLQDLDYKDAASPIDTGCESRNSNSDIESDAISPSQQNVNKSKKVEFLPIEPLAISPTEGGFVSRPLDLPLQDSNDRPFPPPRGKKNRLLSVPNIKPFTIAPGTSATTTGSVTSKPEVRDLRSVNRSKSTKEGGQSASFAGNLMRRFSKYQLCDCEIFLFEIYISSGDRSVVDDISMCIILSCGCLP